MLLNAFFATVGVMAAIAGFWLALVTISAVRERFNSWARDRQRERDRRHHHDRVIEKFAEVKKSADSLMEQSNDIRRLVSDLRSTPYQNFASTKDQRAQNARRTRLQKQLREKVSNKLVREYLYGNHNRVLTMLQRIV